MIRATLLLLFLSGCGLDDPDPSPPPATDPSDGAGADGSRAPRGDESSAPIFLPPAELMRDGCDEALLGERCPLCGALECSPGVWSCKEGRMVCGSRWSA